MINNVSIVKVIEEQLIEAIPVFGGMINGYRLENRIQLIENMIGKIKEDSSTEISFDYITLRSTLDKYLKSTIQINTNIMYNVFKLLSSEEMDENLKLSLIETFDELSSSVLNETIILRDNNFFYNEHSDLFEINIGRKYLGVPKEIDLFNVSPNCIKQLESSGIILVLSGSALGSKLYPITGITITSKGENFFKYIIGNHFR